MRHGATTYLLRRTLQIILASLVEQQSSSSTNTVRMVVQMTPLLLHVREWYHTV